MTTRLTRRLVGVATAGACAIAGLAATGSTAQATAGSARPDAGPLMNIQILSFNDFHGNLEPPAGSSGRVVVDHRIDPATGLPVDVTVDAGGAEYLATHLKQARVGHGGNTLTVAAGDIVGASPLLSAAFHDEPTIESMNKLGLDVTAVGNHEFDEGYKELQRLQRGGCIADGPQGANNQNSCAAHEFEGADFDFLAANVVYKGTTRSHEQGEPILPAYVVKQVGAARIGFIGMTLKDTPSIVTASGVQGLRFLDEVKTANALVPVLKAQGVNAIVVLIHQGGLPDKQQWTDPATGTSYPVNPTYDYTCGGGGSLIPASSPILPIAAKLDPAIDLIVSGHTHQPYVCDVKDPAGNPRMLTSASSFGRLFTDTELVYDKRTNDIVRSSVDSANMVVTRDVPLDKPQTALITTYKRLITPIASKVLGHITADVKQSTPTAAGETPLGDLIADAQVADPSVVTGGQAPVVAFMNPGGIRGDLVAASSPYGEPAGDVTFGEAFTVQPFNNYMVSMTLTGQGLYDLLTQQVTGANAGARKTLQVSKGFSYTMSPTGPVDGSVAINGTPVDKAASYRIVANNFLSDGGDGFAAFAAGTGKYFGGLDINAFAAYLPTVSPYTPATPSRIGGTL